MSPGMKHRYKSLIHDPSPMELGILDPAAIVSVPARDTKKPQVFINLGLTGMTVTQPALLTWLAETITMASNAEGKVSLSPFEGCRDPRTGDAVIVCWTGESDGDEFSIRLNSLDEEINSQGGGTKPHAFRIPKNEDGHRQAADIATSLQEAADLIHEKRKDATE